LDCANPPAFFDGRSLFENGGAPPNSRRLR
jgi:hypothetical protein